MRTTLLTALLVLLWCPLALAGKYAATPAELAQLQKEQDLRILQRRVYENTTRDQLMRRCITALQENGFYIDQAYPLKNQIRAIHNKDVNLLTAVKVLPVPDRHRTFQVWVNLKYETETLASPYPKLVTIEDTALYRKIFASINKVPAYQLTAPRRQ